MRTLRPSAHPNFSNAARNAAWRACASGSVSEPMTKYPMRAIPPDCCALTASGQRVHVCAAVLASMVMKSLRLICLPHGCGAATCNCQDHSIVPTAGGVNHVTRLGELTFFSLPRLQRSVHDWV